MENRLDVIKARLTEIDLMDIFDGSSLEAEWENHKGKIEQDINCLIEGGSIAAHLDVYFYYHHKEGSLFFSDTETDPEGEEVEQYSVGEMCANLLACYLCGIEAGTAEEYVVKRYKSKAECIEACS